MASVNVTINGRVYQIACYDGQEAHLKRLGGYIDKRIAELIASVGQIGDARLLVMASLLIADEMSDAYSRLEAAEATIKQAQLHTMNLLVLRHIMVEGVLK